MLEPGQIVDSKYRVTCQLGSGGMAVVYEAENLRIRRKVAIKVLHAATAAKPDLIQRFEREAQAAGAIGSDHIVEVYDLGRLDDGSPYMVMERLVGETLSDRIKRMGKMPPAAICPLIRQVLRGLEAAHAAGIVHRDLKPSNIFIMKEKAERRDFIKIIDFGISKFQEFTDPDFTHTGVLLGSPNYIAPEQADSSRYADARSDLYSVGVILYKALSGQAPFDAGSLREVLVKIMLSSPPPLSELVPDVDPNLDRIVARAMAREPSFRFQNAQEFVAAIDAWIAGKPIDMPAIEAEATVTDAPLSRALLEGSDSKNRSAPSMTRERGERTSTAARSWASTRSDRSPFARASKTTRAVLAGVGGAIALFTVVLVIVMVTRTDDGEGRATIPSAALPPAQAAAVPPPPDKAESEPAEAQEKIFSPDDLEADSAEDAGRRGVRPRAVRRAAPAPAAAPADPPPQDPPAGKRGGIDWGY